MATKNVMAATRESARKKGTTEEMVVTKVKKVEEKGRKDLYKVTRRPRKK